MGPTHLGGQPDQVRAQRVSHPEGRANIHGRRREAGVLSLKVAARVHCRWCSPCRCSANNFLSGWLVRLPVFSPLLSPPGATVCTEHTSTRAYTVWHRTITCSFVRLFAY